MAALKDVHSDSKEPTEYTYEKDNSEQWKSIWSILERANSEQVWQDNLIIYVKGDIRFKNFCLGAGELAKVLNRDWKLLWQKFLN